MKNPTLIIMMLVYCCASLQLVYASNYTEGKVYRTQLSEPTRAIEQSALLLDDISEKKQRKDSARPFSLTDKNDISKKPRLDISKEEKKKSTRRRNKIKSLSRPRPSPRSFSSDKTRYKTKMKRNRFEDKNGDGINDIVANPKL